MKKDSIGDRMKCYENVTRNYLTRRTPVIMRLDGKAFHTLTRNCVKPFDEFLSDAMISAAKVVMNEAMGAKLAYIQSDEISILLTDYDTLDTESWFDNNIQKLSSISASLASVEFSSFFGKSGHFDCRVFNIPKEDVNNYFIWRQQDWMRNSVQMLTRHYYSQKDMHLKTIPIMHEMLHVKGVNWSKLEPERWKNGVTIIKKTIFEDYIFKDRCHLMDDILNPVMIE
jgi:tRNA(His) 5'-end guanylyltransferase